jgi:hypothetical protein
MVLDGPEGQEGGSADVMVRNERYWMRFLKGMVTDRNTTPSLEFCFHAKLTIGSEAEFIPPIDVSLKFCWVVMDVIQPSGMIGRWVIVGLWVCPLNNGICLCPEDTEVKGVIASSPSEVFGCGIKSDLFHLDVPSIFQCLEDGLEVSFCSFPIRGDSGDSVFWDVEDSFHSVILGE